MSSVLSAQLTASLVDMDHSTEPVNTPSKPFSHDPSSSPHSPLGSSHDSSSKSSPPSSPPSRLVKLEHTSNSSEFSTNVIVNGQAPEISEENHQVPSQAFISERKASEAQNDRSKEDPAWDDQPLPLADGDEDPDFDSGDGDGDWTQDEIEADIRRVKVYELVDQAWTDRGTAFCQGDYLEKQREARLVAHAEHTNEVLVEWIIRSSDIYQRQQATLIVWTEPDGTDYALSFQDIEGCAEVWEFILEVQRHLKDKDEGFNSSEGGAMHVPSTGTMNTFTPAPKLPIPALGQMQECERAIRQNSRLPQGREKLCDVLIQMDYVKHVIDVMQQAEDLEDIKELHACCSCMQTILMLNDHNILEYVLQDHIFYGVVGVLEYDPEFPAHKAFYREFLENEIHFRQPIPIREAATRRKVEQTYRLQFLKDVVLARATDDATFNVLNSCIIFNQIDIVNQVQKDDCFLREMVGLFLTTEPEVGVEEKDNQEAKEGGYDKGKAKRRVKGEEAMDIDQVPQLNGTQKGGLESSSPEIGPVPAHDQGSSPTGGSFSNAECSVDDRRKETILLIQQLCVMGKNVQLPTRLQLFRTLVDRGILHAVQWAIGRPERQMVSTAGEILTVLLDHDVSGVRQHVMKQVGISNKPSMGMCVGVAGRGGDAAGIERKGETLLETLCRLLATSTELAYKSQMADALRAVLDVPPPTEKPDHPPNMPLQPPKDDLVTERFLEYFYKNCCEGLFRPLSELPDHRKLTEPTLHLSRERSNLYLYLCDLLSAFVWQHSYRSHFFIVASSNVKPPIVPRIASLLKTREKHLRLAALRFFRACLKLGNRNMTLHLVQCDVVSRILELTMQEAKWDNLLSSCCQEFFEHIRRENMKELLSHLMIKYEHKIQVLAQLPVCGQRFQGLIRRWEMNNEPPPKESDSQQATPAQKWTQGRIAEVEEEAYFNNSDDEEATPTPSPASPPSPVEMSHTLKRKRMKGFTGFSSASAPKQLRKTAVVPSRLPLVDYDEDEEEGSGASPSSKAEDATLAQETSSPGLSPSRPIDWFSQSQSQALINPTKSPASGELSGGPAFGESPMQSRLVRLSSPPRLLAEKRRRFGDDDEEDELFERLARSKRHQTAGPSSQREDMKPTPTRPLTLGKMKLKLGAASLSLGSSTSPGKDELKDADGG